MGRRSRRQKRENNYEISLKGNLDSYYEYFQLLLNISLGMFEWKNLPEGMDERFIELTLFEDGQACFFWDDVLGYLCLQFTMQGQFDVQRNPTTIRAYAVNGFNQTLSTQEYVPIWNNFTRTNCVNKVYTYARRLWDLDRTIDVNARAQKTPVLVKGTEAQRLTLLNLYKEFDGNSPVIFGGENLDINGLGAISTQAPFVADKIYDIKTKIWNEALAYLGVGNLSVNKRERLLSSEVGQSIVGTVATRYTRLGMRQMACEQINKKFGLDIWCDYRFDNVETGEFLNISEGGDLSE